MPPLTRGKHIQSLINENIMLEGKILLLEDLNLKYKKEIKEKEKIINNLYNIIKKIKLLILSIKII